ncbi:MAG TPA: hypothetical protein VMW25_02835 [Clostridia bacterium]|nr:hypothetical protein [Clostridia bacterium]
MKRLFLFIIIIYSFFSLYNYLVQKNPQNTLFEYLKKALSRSPSLRCEYTNEEGKPQIVYLKDDFLRGEGIKTPTGQSTIIVREEKLWIWAEDSPGIVFDLSENQSYSSPKKKIVIRPREILEKIEYQKQNCSPAIVSELLFEPPENIKFLEPFEYFEAINEETLQF